MVSIIMPSYNASKFIGESIESVLNQTYQDWELLITDDCSKDNSREIIESYILKDNRIKLYQLPINGGAAVARNHSINKARGKYIAFLDSDDIWSSTKLEEQIAFMQSNNLPFSFTAYDQMTEEGVVLNKIINVPKEISYHGYLKNTIIGCLTVIIDRSIVGDFEMPNIKTSQDMATWLLVLKRGFKAYGFNKNLATYRLVGNSNSAKKSKAAKDVWRVYRDIEKLSIVYSALCFCGYAFNAIKKRL
ncbi:glycosyltransferase family 2 protein [Myroides marinus]|uniref:glycosyltransferase family 2 protein n=1 Tax=Myroides marinus TaxID=703342 RepID=UPI0025787BFA|nr:glycosyltransferase family 2 protein [Myroides marinus]